VAKEERKQKRKKNEGRKKGQGILPVDFPF
jgi:hypothetical protein